MKIYGSFSFKDCKIEGDCNIVVEIAGPRLDQILSCGVLILKVIMPLRKSRVWLRETMLPFTVASYM